MEGVLAALQYHGSDQPQEPPLGTSYLVTRGASFMNAFAVIRLYSIYSLWQKWLWIPRKIGSIFCIVEPGNPELEPHSGRPASASKSGHPTPILGVDIFGVNTSLAADTERATARHLIMQLHHGKGGLSHSIQW